MVDQLEQQGIVGPPDGSKPREVLITRQQYLEMVNYKENEQRSMDDYIDSSDEEQLDSDDKAEEEFDEDYVQLCQLSTFESDNCGFMFGDGGNLYFYIKKSDLAEKRFDKVKISLQCY